MILIDADLEAMFNHVADGISTEAEDRRLGELLRASLDTRRAYRDSRETKLDLGDNK